MRFLKVLKKTDSDASAFLDETGFLLLAKCWNYKFLGTRPDWNDTFLAYSGSAFILAYSGSDAKMAFAERKNLLRRRPRATLSAAWRPMSSPFYFETSDGDLEPSRNKCFRNDDLCSGDSASFRPSVAKVSPNHYFHIFSSGFLVSFSCVFFDTKSDLRGDPKSDLRDVPKVTSKMFQKHRRKCSKKPPPSWLGRRNS